MSDKIIKGIIRVTTIRYFKDNFGILVATPVKTESKIKPQEDKEGKFIVKGTIPKVEVGDDYNVVMKEVIDPKWGVQYDVMFIGTAASLNTPEERQSFLMHIMTDRQYEAVINTLENPFEVIKNGEIHKLAKVRGIGVTTADRIIEKYKQTIDYSDIYIKLDKLGMTDRMIKKLCEAYGSPDVLIEKFETNPYILADEVSGIGFKKADELALKYGIERNSPYRFKAYIEYHLEEQANKGNSYVDTKGLFDALIKTLGEDLDRKEIGMAAMEMENKDENPKGKLWFSDDKMFIGLKKYRDLAYSIKDELVRLMGSPSNFDYDDWEGTVDELEKKQGFQFTDEQRKGIKKVLDNQVVVVTGFGGTGKSTIVSGMLEVLKDYSFKQTALAGRAASRLFEITGEEGYTIHRLLEYNPREGWSRNKDNQLEDDIIILDEASMVDAVLFYRLIQAIKTGSKIIMLGDTAQLESIGVGNILHDLIDSRVIPSVRLTKIHRQAQKSAIKTESLKARKGVHIVEKGFEGKQVLGELKDLELDVFNNSEETIRKVIAQFKEKINEVGGIMDIQILSPLNDRGDACNFNINKAVQHLYNPFAKNQIEIFITKDKRYLLKEGDKVINTKNNYKTLNLQGDETPIFNGSLGIIEKINKEDHMMLINFDGIGRVLVKRKDWPSIQLGYSISVHKYQGSEAHTVIMAMDYSAYILLSRELLYTGITRAKKKCVIVGESKAIRYATSKSNIKQKKTFLKEILKNEVKL